MASAAKYKEHLKLLHDEASKVIDDLSSLSKVIADVGDKTSQEAQEDVGEYLEKEIANLQERMTQLNQKVRESAKIADDHVRTNPYLYILGSLGLGFLLGKITTPRSRE